MAVSVSSPFRAVPSRCNMVGVVVVPVTSVRETLCLPIEDQRNVTWFRHLSLGHQRLCTSGTSRIHNHPPGRHPVRSPSTTQQWNGGSSRHSQSSALAMVSSRKREDTQSYDQRTIIVDVMHGVSERVSPAPSSTIVEPPIPALATLIHVVRVVGEDMVVSFWEE